MLGIEREHGRAIVQLLERLVRSRRGTLGLDEEGGIELEQRLDRRDIIARRTPDLVATQRRYSG
jgi:hypothetical protein